MSIVIITNRNKKIKTCELLIPNSSHKKIISLYCEWVQIHIFVNFSYVKNVIIYLITWTCVDLEIIDYRARGSRTKILLITNSIFGCNNCLIVL